MSKLTASSSPADVRWASRVGTFAGPTAGLASGFTQLNLVIVAAEFANDFALFCSRNPRPCPLLEQLPPGEFRPRLLAPDADLRIDLPRYRVWKDGELVDEPTDIRRLWRDDFVSFLIGCSFTFEAALLKAGVPIRHLEMGCNVPMYRTSRPCSPAGVFSGPLVVSMRPMTPVDAERSIQITRRYPLVHGEPVHSGDPTALGIIDIRRPDFGDPVPLRDGESPVFWACGVTPQAALHHAKLPLAITHSPGCMFVSDLRDAVLCDRTEWP